MQLDLSCDHVARSVGRVHEGQLVAQLQRRGRLAVVERPADDCRSRPTCRSTRSRRAGRCSRCSGRCPSARFARTRRWTAISASVGHRRRRRRRGRRRWRRDRAPGGRRDGRRRHRRAWTGRAGPAGGASGLELGAFAGAAAGTGRRADVARLRGSAAICWTNGSLLSKRPNEISWFESRTTATRSVFGNLPPATRPPERRRRVDGRERGAAVCPLWPSTFGSSKPRTASRTTEPTAMKIFWRRTRLSAKALDGVRAHAPTAGAAGAAGVGCVLAAAGEDGEVESSGSTPARNRRCGSVSEDVRRHGQRCLDLRERVRTLVQA